MQQDQALGAFLGQPHMLRPSLREFDFLLCLIAIEAIIARRGYVEEGLENLAFIVAVRAIIGLEKEGHLA